MVADIDMMKIRKVVRKTCTEIRKIGLLKDVKTRKRFEENVMELVDIAIQNFGDILGRGFNGM